MFTIAPILQRWHRHAVFPTQDEAETFLGVIDAVFMAVYGIVMLISGWLGDRIDPRYLMAGGMLLGGVAVSVREAIGFLHLHTPQQFIFGALTDYTQFYNIGFYVFCYILYAIGQGTAWPNLVKVMAAWFGHGRRGAIMGFWSNSQYTGHIISSPIIAVFLYYGYEVLFGSFRECKSTTRRFRTYSALPYKCGAVLSPG